jgi:hypothetical protein
VRSSSRDTTDLLRSAGGVLVAAGAAAVFLRKADHHGWSHVALLLVVAAPALALYVLAIEGADGSDDRSVEPWRSVLMVAAILLGPLAIGQLLEVLGADTGSAFFAAAIFALTGIVAAYGAWRARVPYAALLAGLSLLVAWLIACSRLLHPSLDGFRVLLIGGGALLFVAASVIERRPGAIGASEVATAAGVAAVAAGALGVLVGTFLGVARPFTAILAHGHAGGSPFGLSHQSGLQSGGWDLYLLLVSVGLVGVGARARARGLGYVGGLGVAVFVYSVGVEVTRIESGHGASTALVGWPLALLALGVVGLAAPALAGGDN